MTRETAFKELLECLRDNFYEQRSVHGRTPQFIWWLRNPGNNRILYSYDELVLGINEDGYFIMCGTSDAELTDARTFLQTLKDKVRGEE